MFPLSIRIRCAYDVLSGNPFKRYSELDFSLFKAVQEDARAPLSFEPKGSLAIRKRDADCWPVEPNEMDIKARTNSFSVEVVGFDPNRDLVIEAQS